MDLTNEQWQRIVESFPHPRAQPDSSRWPLQDFRAVLNGILWVLQTGAPWADLPARCPPKSTCHRRFQEWTASGVFGEILTALAEDLRDRGGIALSGGFIAGTVAPGVEGGDGVGKTKRGKGTKIMGLADAGGLPLAVSPTSDSPHEVTLVEPTSDACFVDELPERLIGDKAYDSDRLDARLAEERGVEMIAPHQRGRPKAITQDGRPLPRYRRRWKIEPLFAWLQNFRRLVVRYEYHLPNSLGVIQLACIIILLRRVLG